MNPIIKICKKTGCSNYSISGGYCKDHYIHTPIGRAKFDGLYKTEESRKFYTSGRWIHKQREYKSTHPLCKKCTYVGRVKKTDIVHHTPPLEYLLEQGLDPYSDQYLESICYKHHNAELKKKQLSKIDKNNLILKRILNTILN